MKREAYFKLRDFIQEIGQQVSKEVFNFEHIDIHLHLSGFRKCIVFPPQDMHPPQGLQ